MLVLKVSAAARCHPRMFGGAHSPYTHCKVSDHAFPTSHAHNAAGARQGPGRQCQASDVCMVPHTRVRCGGVGLLVMTLVVRNGRTVPLALAPSSSRNIVSVLVIHFMGADVVSVGAMSSANRSGIMMAR